MSVSKPEPRRYISKTNLERRNPDNHKRDKHPYLKQNPEEGPDVHGYARKHETELRAVGCVGFSEEAVVCNVPCVIQKLVPA